MKKSKKNGKKRGDTLGMVLIAILEALMLLLVAFLLLMVVRLRGQQAAATSAFVEQSVKPTKTVETENVVYDPNEAEVVPSPVITPQPTPEPTPEPTPTPTPEPQPEYFKLSFVGDNTLWATSNFENNPVGLPLTVGDDTSYPYKNTVKYFSEDEYTLANLECSFSDKKLGYDYTATTFPFLAKASYVNILLDGGVDFVTMRNNPALDFYQAGVESTQSVLNEAGLPYGYENQGQIVTTPHGLKLGIWTSGNDLLPNKDKAVNGIQELRNQGAEIVICMFHWGQELYYSPNDNQITLAHACVDAGADIVYGTHPHCLQPVEIYNGKIIMYSLGNWVFGGNTQPSDPDTAIIQAIIKRDVDGTVSYDSFTCIPCCVSSNIEGGNAKANNTDYNVYANYNNYCPTPYEEGSEGFERAMSKLMGTYQAKSQGADYSDYYASWS